MGFETIKNSSKKAMKSSTFHLKVEQIKPLKEAAEALHVSQSEIVRQSINNFLEWFNRDQTSGEKKRA
ncbi:MAG: CopG family transcriptional regulator [Nitrospinae bacterium]|nr:CopG family transcriptional regulator [Nitrospinota bacterium]